MNMSFWKSETNVREKKYFRKMKLASIFLLGAAEGYTGTCKARM